eukprot:sb/3471996/
MEIMRLDYAGTSEEMNVEPQLVTDNYNYIKQFPESKLTPDSVGTVYKDINTLFRYSFNPLSKEEIIDDTLDEAFSTKKLEEQLRQCKNELDEHRVNVIELQQKLIKSQEEQLSTMTNSVQKVKAYSTVGTGPERCRSIAGGEKVCSESYSITIHHCLRETKTSLFSVYQKRRTA